MKNVKLFAFLLCGLFFAAALTIYPVTDAQADHEGLCSFENNNNDVKRNGNAKEPDWERVRLVSDEDFEMMGMYDMNGDTFVCVKSTPGTMIVVDNSRPYVPERDR